MSGSETNRIGSGGSAASGPWILLPVGLAMLLLLPFRGYLTDDGYIYSQFARNLASGHGFSFNAGAPVYGFTSPLWVLLLAACSRLGVPLLIAARLLGALFALLSVPAFHRLARQIIPTARGAFAATLAWSLNVWLIRWALGGLETSLAVFLVLAAVGAWMKERSRGAAPRFSAVLLGLAALTRPECLGLILLAGVDLVVLDRARWTHLLRLVAGVGVVLLPWFLYAELAFGRLLPGTIFAKSGGAQVALAALVSTLRRIVPVYGATVAVEIMTIAVVAVMFRRMTRGENRREARGDSSGETRGDRRALLAGHFLPLAWMIALPALYVVRGAGVVSRYMLPSIPFVVLYGFAALDRLRAPDTPRRASEPMTAGPIDTGRFRKLRARAPWLLLSAAAVLNLTVLLAAALPSARSFTRGLDGSLVPIAAWLRENTPPEATVATPDIGAIGYLSGRTVIDLRGLVTPALAPLQRPMTYDQIVESVAFARVVRPDYLVDRYTAPLRFTGGGNAAGLFEPILWRRMGDLGIIRRGDYYYTLYRLHWDRYR